MNLCNDRDRRRDTGDAVVRRVRPAGARSPSGDRRRHSGRDGSVRCSPAIVRVTADRGQTTRRTRKRRPPRLAVRFAIPRLRASPALASSPPVTIARPGNATCGPARDGLRSPIVSGAPVLFRRSRYRVPTTGQAAPVARGAGPATAAPVTIDLTPFTVATGRVTGTLSASPPSQRAPTTAKGHPERRRCRPGSVPTRGGPSVPKAAATGCW